MTTPRRSARIQQRTPHDDIPQEAAREQMVGAAREPSQLWAKMALAASICVVALPFGLLLLKAGATA